MEVTCAGAFEGLMILRQNAACWHGSKSHLVYPAGGAGSQSGLCAPPYWLRPQHPWGE